MVVTAHNNVTQLNQGLQLT